MALAHTSATVTHHTFFQQYSLVWDLFISWKSAYINWDFFTSEYNHWTQEKRSIWFSLLVETVAYYLMWQMMLGKKGLRFLCLGNDSCDVWPHILAASHQLAKDALSMTENNTASIYTVEISTGSHPSAALPGNFLAIENRRALDQALTTVHRETLGRDGRVDERGNVVGITHYADTCPGSQNISPEREREMRCDVLKRVGGYDGPANWELGRPLTEEEKQAELIWTKRGSYITRLGNEMQELYETPFANMSFKDLQAIFIAKMTERGNNSAATIDGEETGVHLRMQGEGAGVDLTMSMSARGSKSLGSQRTSERLMLLEFVSSTVEPDAPPVAKYTRNQADIAVVLLKNQFFKKLNGNSKDRIREWKDAASNNRDDNSHPFTTKPRSDSARRATDEWTLSLHESVASVLTVAPNATEVNDADRAVSASSRADEAQKKKESRKRKP